MTVLPDLLHLLREAGFGEMEVHGSYADRLPGPLGVVDGAVLDLEPRGNDS
jgi:hypothetical protein